MNKITRIWHGITKAEHAEEYLKYIEITGLLDYKKVDGNLSARILRRKDGNICHFLTITEWNSYESIKKFAGNDFEKQDIMMKTRNIFWNLRKTYLTMRLLNKNVPQQRIKIMAEILPKQKIKTTINYGLN